MHMQHLPLMIAFQLLIELLSSYMLNVNHLYAQFVTKHSGTRSAYIASEKDDKQFICGVCIFKTNNLVDWKSHELSYGHRQTFACPICEKKFTQKCNMKAHIRLHTGEKPYKCKLCFQTFTYQSALRGHMMARHKISVNYSQTEMQTIN
ncbi:Zinc finger and SCAN domain-containing [Argiope bruennichi]|uniref:Zinc finger and SCAN domain-containing n=1 Tax=Argiope bruennichi TaxID=94029 RepID=A0A8T0E520_ARGBR|nr:Zinc finger and SCAN domain-containing [Argiope bruennichi]